MLLNQSRSLGLGSKLHILCRACGAVSSLSFSINLSPSYSCLSCPLFRPDTLSSPSLPFSLLAVYSYSSSSLLVPPDSSTLIEHRFVNTSKASWDPILKNKPEIKIRQYFRNHIKKYFYHIVERWTIFTFSSFMWDGIIC